MERLHADDGFSLVELLTVIVIVGTLAAVSIPVFLNQRTSAFESAVASDVRNAGTTVESERVRNDEVPSASDLDGLVDVSEHVTVFYAADGSGFCVHAVHDELDGDVHGRYDSEGGFDADGDACAGADEVASG